jgi:hypothetical protein
MKDDVAQPFLFPFFLFIIHLMSFKKKTFRLSCKESLCRDSCKKTFVNKISADYQAFQVKKNTRKNTQNTKF